MLTSRLLGFGFALGFLLLTDSLAMNSSDRSEKIDPITLTYRYIPPTKTQRDENTERWHLRTQRELRGLFSSEEELADAPNLAKFRIVAVYRGGNIKLLEFPNRIFVSGSHKSDRNRGFKRPPNYTCMGMEEFGDSSSPLENLFEDRRIVADLLGFRFKYTDANVPEERKRAGDFFAKYIQQAHTSEPLKIKLFSNAITETSFDSESNVRAEKLFNGRTAGYMLSPGVFEGNFYDSEQVILRFVISSSSPTEKSPEVTRGSSSSVDVARQTSSRNEQKPSSSRASTSNSSGAMVPDNRNLSDVDLANNNNNVTRTSSLSIENTDWAELLPGGNQPLEELRMDIASTREMCDACYETYTYGTESGGERKGPLLSAIKGALSRAYQTLHPEVSPLNFSENLRFRVIVSGRIPTAKPTWVGKKTNN